VFVEIAMAEKSSRFLVTDQGSGAVVNASFRTPRHFNRWLELLAAIARDLFPAAAATHFIERAHRNSAQFRRRCGKILENMSEIAHIRSAKPLPGPHCNA
jgi:hypothetical protein